MNMIALILTVVAFFHTNALAANDVETVHANYFGTSLRQLTSSLFPFEVDVSPNEKLWIGHAGYVGAVDELHGIFLAICLPPGSTEIKLVSLDLNNPLDDQAKAVLEANPTLDWAVVAKITAGWEPWNLQLTSDSFGSAVKQGAASAPPKDLPKVLKSGKPFNTISVSNIRFDAGSKQIEYAMSLHFAANHIKQSFVPKTKMSSWKSGMEDPTVPFLSSSSPSSGIVASIDTAHLNGILLEAFKDQEFPVLKDTSGKSILTLKHLAVATTKERMTLTGDMRHVATATEAGIELLTQGADLTAAQLKVIPKLKDCSGLKLIEKVACEVNNATKQAVAKTLSGTLTNLVAGKTIRPFGVNEEHSVQLWQRSFVLKLILSQMAASDSEIIVMASSSLEPK